MRSAWFLVVGLGFVWMGCGDSSSAEGFFAPSTTGASQGASVTGTGASTASTGSATGGTGGSGTVGTSVTTSGTGGGSSVGTGGSVVGGASGAAGATGGKSGAGGASSGGASGASGSGTAGNAGSGTAGLMPDGGGGQGMDGGAGTGGMGGGDAGGMGGRVDAGPDGGPRTIRCGTSACTVQTQFCCVRSGLPPVCVLAGGLCPDNADRVYCDDRADCGAINVCCAQDFTNGSAYATCVVPSQCTNAGQGMRQSLCNPQEPNACIGLGNSCRVDDQAIIDGYPYCH